MKSFHDVVWLRFGAGAIPCRRRTFPTVWSDTSWPRLAQRRRSVIPQPEFSRAISRSRLSTSERDPRSAGVERCFEPSNFCRDQLAPPAEDRLGFCNLRYSRQALRPSRFPISASVLRSALDKREPTWQCALRIRFSAARYST